MPRETSIRLGTDELEQLRTVKREIYGEDIAESVPHGLALQELIDSYQADGA